MKTTCGIFIISNCHLLLVHATNAKANSWSIPKGIKSEFDVNDLDAALRETEEETGIDLIKHIKNIFEIVDLGSQIYKTGRKILHGYLVNIKNDITDIELKCESVFITKQNKEIPEIDKFKWIDLGNWDEFYKIHESQSVLYDRYINSLKKYYNIK